MATVHHGWIWTAQEATCIAKSLQYIGNCMHAHYNSRKEKDILPFHLDRFLALIDEERATSSYKSFVLCRVLSACQTQSSFKLLQGGRKMIQSDYHNKSNHKNWEQHELSQNQIVNQWLSAYLETTTLPSLTLTVNHEAMIYLHLWNESCHAVLHGYFFPSLLDGSDQVRCTALAQVCHFEVESPF